MRIAIIGRTEICYDTAELLAKQGHEIALVITAKEASEYEKTSADFKDLAAGLAAQFIHAGRFTVEVIAQIKSLGRLDIGISINYPTIISSEVVNLFKHGILNAHGGDLPRYRGNACSAWAIINGEDRVGLCIHKMIGGELDAGDIICREYFRLSENSRIGEVWSWMSDRVPELFATAVGRLTADNTYVLEVQSRESSDALRCYPRRPEDGRLNWSVPAIDAIRLINASSEPYAGAFCDLDGEKLIVWRAERVTESEDFLAVPGQVTLISLETGIVEIATINGKIKITEAELNGVRALPANFVKSTRQRLK